MTSAARDVGAVPSADPPPAPSLGRPARLHWQSLSDGMLVSFMVAGPALFASFILRDQRVHSWPLILLIGLLGFGAGGAIAGRHRRTRGGAILQGLALGVLTASVIVVADLIRRLALAQGLALGDQVLWLVVWVAALASATVGALYGRHRYLRSRRRQARVKPVRARGARAR